LRTVVKESAYRFEVPGSLIHPPNSNGEVIDFVHHAGLKQVLQELMVHHSPTSLHFQHESTGSMVRVRVERLLNRATPPEKYRDTNFLILVLAGFNFETYYL